MYISRVIEQIRFDFTAILSCEHCDNTEYIETGYDDQNYHVNVIPKFKCKACGKDRAGKGEG